MNATATEAKSVGDAAGKPKPAAKKPAEKKVSTKPAKKAAAKPAAKAAPKAAAKPAEKAKPAKKPNKLDVVHDLLTREKGATREELSKASGWPYVNLKMSAERAGMDLVCLSEEEKRFKLVPPKKGAAAAAPAKA